MTRDTINVFLSLVVEAAPFVLLGVLASTLVSAFVRDEWVIRLVPKNRVLGPVVGTFVGFLFPVCECGNVPLARRLIAKGAPPNVAIAFLLAAPAFNPIVIVATYAAFPDRPEILFFRIVFSVVIAVAVGVIFSFAGDPDGLLRPSVAAEARAARARAAARTPLRLPDGRLLSPIAGAAPASGEVLGAITATHDHDHDRTAPRGRGAANVARLDAIAREFLEMGGALVIGAAVAAVVQVLFSRDSLAGIGQGPVSSIAAMLLLAAVVSICSNVDAFFALAYSTTFTTGALLAFLVFGPMFDIKGLVMMRTVFASRTLVAMVALTLLMTAVLTLAVNLHLS